MRRRLVARDVAGKLNVSDQIKIVGEGRRIKTECAAAGAQMLKYRSLRALSDTWQIDAILRASDADGIVNEKTWSEDIPRDLA